MENPTKIGWLGSSRILGKYHKILIYIYICIYIYWVVQSPNSFKEQGLCSHGSLKLGHQLSRYFECDTIWEFRPLSVLKLLKKNSKYSMGFFSGAYFQTHNTYEYHKRDVIHQDVWEKSMGWSPLKWCLIFSYEIHHIYYWLVVGPPLWKIWVRQLGWLETQYMGK